MCTLLVNIILYSSFKIGRCPQDVLVQLFSKWKDFIFSLLIKHFIIFPAFIAADNTSCWTNMMILKYLLFMQSSLSLSRKWLMQDKPLETVGGYDDHRIIIQIISLIDQIWPQLLTVHQLTPTLGDGWWITKKKVENSGLKINQIIIEWETVCLE